MDSKSQWTFNIQREVNLERIVQDVVNLIPTQSLDSGITSVRLVLEGEIFTSEAFVPTRIVRNCEIVVAGEPSGTLELFYMAPPAMEYTATQPDVSQLMAFSAWFARLLLWSRRETTMLQELEESVALAQKLLGTQHEEAQGLAEEMNDIFVLRSMGVSLQGVLG